MKRKRKIFIVMVLFIALFYCFEINQKPQIQSASATVDNTKIEWGIKRNENHKQPDLGKKNKEILEKHNGIALGNNEKPYVYLTFDLGYEAGYTDKILDTLKENKVQGVFFITAHYLNTQPELVKRMINEGHIVGNHTVNHKSMPSLTNEEIKKEVMDLHQAIFQKYNYEMKYIRPPKGEFSERTIEATEKLGYKTVMWSFAYVDWDEKKQPSEQEALNRIMENLHNGEIMLLHGTSKTNAGIMDEMIKKVKEAGYEFRSIENFI